MKSIKFLKELQSFHDLEQQRIAVCVYNAETVLECRFYMAMREFHIESSEALRRKIKMRQTLLGFGMVIVGGLLRGAFRSRTSNGWIPSPVATGPASKADAERTRQAITKKLEGVEDVEEV